MWFFPIGHADNQPARGTAGALLRDRYEAYKADMRTTFFDTHFEDLDRQIVLVDVLGALHAGKEAFDDTARAITDIAAGFSYGRNLARPVHEIGAAALHVGGHLLGRSGYGSTRAADAVSRALKTRRIRKRSPSLRPRPTTCRPCAVTTCATSFAP